ncbi:MAG: YceD family protein [Bauldia sp.]
MSEHHHPFSRHVALSAISPSGSEREIAATDSERAAIVADFGLVALPRLVGRLDLRRSGDLVTIDGRLEAEAIQSCVVSLQPVTQRIDLAFTRRLLRGQPAEPSTDGETVEIGEEDPPDVFAGDSIDVGRVLLEEFALALDPYPRAPGVAFAVPEEAAEGEPESPFAVLKSLGKPDAT